MATGRSTQLLKQLGEYIVASELARQGLMVATFSGNVPDYDLMACDENGRSLPIQVKTIRGGSWQFSFDRFMEVSFEGKRQVLGKKVKPNIPHLLCVFVVADTYGKDRFFIFEWEELQDIIIERQTEWLARHDYVRPRSPKSLHSSIAPDNIPQFENRWDKIYQRLSG